MLVNSLEELSSLLTNDTIISIGMFDGVHLGHQSLIRRIANLSKSSLKSVIITFSVHPKTLTSNSKELLYLTTNEQKYNLISDLGIDYVLFLDFSKELKDISYQDFFLMLRDKLKMRILVMGFNHSFGSNRAGTFENVSIFNNSLESSIASQTANSYRRVELILHKEEGKCISSRYIRELITQGKIAEANSYLGYDFKN